MLSKRTLFIFATLAQFFSLALFRHDSMAGGWLLLSGAFALLLCTLFYALREDLTRGEVLPLFLPPTLLFGSAGWLLSSLPYQSLLWYGVLGSFLPLAYTTLLTVNILNVASGKSIPLVRAARTAGFVTSVSTAFFYFSSLFSQDFTVMYQLLGVGVGSAVVAYPFFWAFVLEAGARVAVLLSLLGGALLMQGAFVLSLIELHFIARSFVLATILYSSLGILRLTLEHQTDKRHVIEYVGVCVTVISLLLFQNLFLL